MRLVIASGVDRLNSGGMSQSRLIVMPTVAPFGSWKSPITSNLYASAYTGLSQVILDGSDIYWNELRPLEKGRNVIVKRTPDGRMVDVTPEGFNARTRVHEYGGGAYNVAKGTVYFSNYTDQRLYRQDHGREPQPLTPPVDMRYADSVFDNRRNRLICVREDHTTGSPQAVNTLVSLGLEKEGPGNVLVSGADFYSNPRLNPDGSRLAWLAWNHPNMPWDGTKLFVAGLNADGSLGSKDLVAGGLDESIFQPEWSPDGILYFVSDKTGWWNLYRWVDGQVQPLCPMEAEFGQPQWAFRKSNYAFESPDRIICIIIEKGRSSRLARLDVNTGNLETVENEYSEHWDIVAGTGYAVLLAGSPSQPASVIRLDLPTGKIEALKRSRDALVDDGYISPPHPIKFPTTGGRTAHAFFYPPKNQDQTGPSQERPPLIVMSHGGPTGSTSTTLAYGIQYWTSRGIAVVDVDYGGSTGYGREYRQQLNGLWGIVDVDDCANAARYLADKGEVDGNRMAITGGSAGGYTTLCALTFRNVFKAGASYFGVSDLEGLAKDTHKFESRYLDKLVGPYPARKDLYMERSPINFAERISVPMIFFQGLEDKVVPPSQSERIFDAVRKKGIPTAYIPFEGEQHGFRRAENLKRSIEAELYFYSRIFRFDPADTIESLRIENLDARPETVPLAENA